MGGGVTRRVWISATIVLAAGLFAAEDKLVVRIPMRDGVRLTANVFKPDKVGKWPTLLVRTPYNRGTELTPNYRVFVDRGFVVVVQDVRGRYESEGSFKPLQQELPDGSDTLNWIARQPWSDGKVGMIGGSYVGIVQWKAALSRNPHLKAIFPVVAGSDEYRDRFYSQGGAMKLGHRLLWIAENLRLPSHPRPLFQDFIRHLPLRTADYAATGQRVEFWQDALNHPSYDSYWRAVSTRAKLEDVATPAFIVAGWYDNFAQSDLETFSILSQRSAAHRIVVGPWAHNMSMPFADVSFGSESGAPIRSYQLDWFDYWMRTPQPAREFQVAPVRLFVMGINRWRDEREWPLSRARYTPFYLSGRGNANSAAGDGALVRSEPTRGDQPDDFVYDPKSPVPTAGGSVCCNPRVYPWGPMDQRPVENRRDVLVYSTPPLTRDLEVTGPIKAVLYVSTTALDTDFTAKLVDVYPDGRAINLTDGILRMRYRYSLEEPVLAKPGEIYQLTVDTGVTSNVFRAGHRIRLEISSSNFPRFDRNPNTGSAVADEGQARLATQTVYHGRVYPSHVMLPVVP